MPVGSTVTPPSAFIHLLSASDQQQLDLAVPLVQLCRLGHLQPLAQLLSLRACTR